MRRTCSSGLVKSFTHGGIVERNLFFTFVHVIFSHRRMVVNVYVKMNTKTHTYCQTKWQWNQCGDGGKLNENDSHMLSIDLQSAVEKVLYITGGKPKKWVASVRMNP